MASLILAFPRKEHFYAVSFHKDIFFWELRFAYMQKINLRIDQLTRSVTHRQTGESFKTKFIEVDQKYLLQNKKRLNCLFDWNSEVTTKGRSIFRLVLTEYEMNVIGMISIQTYEDHIFVYLVERIGGRKNPFIGVGGNLFAFACKLAFEKSLNGNVAFLPKTKLIDHFSVTLGAVLLLNGRMGILEAAALKLVKTYFPDEKIGQQ